MNMENTETVEESIIRFRRGTVVTSVTLLAIVMPLVLAAASYSTTYLTVHLILFCLLIPASACDLYKGIIPNGLIMLGLSSSLFFMYRGMLSWPDALWAALGVFALMLGIRRMGMLLFEEPGMGMGDVKLFLVAALFLEWEVYWVLYLSIMCAGLFAVSGLSLGLIDRKTRLPFAPFITVASVIGLYWLPWSLISGW